MMTPFPPNTSVSKKKMTWAPSFMQYLMKLWLITVFVPDFMNSVQYVSVSENYWLFDMNMNNKHQKQPTKLSIII